MIKYGTVERREGDFALQEVVKDYKQEIVNKNHYKLISLRIIRTPNRNKPISFNPLVCVGEEYFHRVCFVARAGNYKTYFSNFNLKFPDTQEGLDAAEKTALKVILEYGKEKTRHPKKWNMFEESWK